MMLPISAKRELERQLDRALEEAVIDWTRNSLDPVIFSQSGDIYEMEPEVVRFVRGVVDDIDQEIIRVNDFFVKGSILSYQWLDHTDFDVMILVDDMSEDDRDRIQKEVDARFGDQTIPGTEHPLQIYVQPGEYDFKNADGVYYLDNRKWYKGPYNFRVNIGDYMSKFQKVVGSIDMATGELKRDLVDYELLKQLPKAEIANLSREVESKLGEINQNIDDLVYQYRHIRDMRHKAFSDDMTPQEIVKYGSKNELPDNVIFKLLERYYYIKMMWELKNLIDDIGVVKDKDVEDVKDIVDQV